MSTLTIEFKYLEGVDIWSLSPAQIIDLAIKIGLRNSNVSQNTCCTYTTSLRPALAALQLMYNINKNNVNNNVELENKIVELQDIVDVYDKREILNNRIAERIKLLESQQLLINGNG